MYPANLVPPPPFTARAVAGAVHGQHGLQANGETRPPGLPARGGPRDSLSRGSALSLAGEHRKLLDRVRVARSPKVLPLPDRDPLREQGAAHNSAAPHPPTSAALHPPTSPPRPAPPRRRTAAARGPSSRHRRPGEAPPDRWRRTWALSCSPCKRSALRRRRRAAAAVFRDSLDPSPPPPPLPASPHPTPLSPQRCPATRDRLSARSRPTPTCGSPQRRS